VTSSVTLPFDCRCPLSHRLPIVSDPLSPLVSEMFALKVADTHTHPQTSTGSDNKVRLELSAREPKISRNWSQSKVFLVVSDFLPSSGEQVFGRIAVVFTSNGVFQRGPPGIDFLAIVVSYLENQNFPLVYPKNIFGQKSFCENRPL